MLEASLLLVVELLAQATGQEVGVARALLLGAGELAGHLHSTLAVTPDGLPLGVLRTRFDAPEPKGQAAASAAERAEEKEKKSLRRIEGLRDCATVARALPQTRVISVCDREADFSALFAEQQRMSLPTSMIPPGGRFSHRHDPIREAFFSRP